MATDEDTVDVVFKTIKVPGPARGSSYGLHFRGSCPVMLADVDPGSPADKAGLVRGDFLVQLNGNDIQRSSEEAVRTIIKYSHGSKLNVRIARPHPFPSTDYLRRRAIITLQTKLAAGVADTNDDVTSYKKTVESAFLEVQDILGSLGLGDDDDLHGNNQSIQEVKVSYQGDGNSLESPPDSEKDPFEVLDPLLDFGLDDDLTINKGSGGRDSTGADLVKSTIEVQRALKGMKQLTDGINAAKEQKRLENERGKVTTEATFTANFQSSSTTNRTPQQPSASPYTAPNGNSSWSPKESNIPSASRVAPTTMNGVRERAVQEQSNVLHSERKSASSSSNGYKQERNSGRGVVAPPTFREQQEEDEDEDFSHLKPTRSPPPRLDQPVERRKKKKAIKQTFSAPPPPVAPYQPREKVVQSSPSSSTAYSRRSKDQAPPPSIPPYNPAGPEEFLLSNKPEYKKEWKKMTNTYEAVPERETVSHPPPTDVAVYEIVRERGAAPLPTRAANWTSSSKEQVGETPQLRITNETNLERSTSPPPPVPVRQHHSLSKTVSEPPSLQKSPATSSRDKYKDVSLADVPLRSKKRGANQVATAPQEPAPVGHVEQRESGRKMKYDLSSAAASSLPVPVKDVSDVLTACAGLPSNVYQWKKDDVGVWLKQMSPTLHTRYSSLFAKHDVTGRTLLRLNATKLQSLGVNTPSHCRILATEIMRVRIHQEANELRAFRR